MFSSPRHRSSTLKPPARLNIPPQTTQLFQRPTSPASAQFTSPSAPPAPRPTSPAPNHHHPQSIAPSHHSGGFRAHLAHLLPRHAAFTVTVTLHQLHNVPLVHGEFALKWKIKGVTSHSGNGILDKVKARKAKGKLCDRGRSGTANVDPSPSLTQGSDTDNASLFDAASASDAHSIANSSSTHAHSTGGSAHGHTTRTQLLPIPAVVVSTNHASPPLMARSVSGTSSIASMGSASSLSSTSPHANGRFVNNPPGFLSAGWARHGHALDAERPPSAHGSTTHHSQTQAKHYYSPAKGITPFVKLKEHSIVWEETLKLVVQMSVGRDNAELSDCRAKFVVMQRVVAGDPDAPRNPRLGVVYLNLAQYVDAGVITRRYLLRQSKTNATLKLTVHLEHTAGELAYVAPPLPKGEILSGVAGFLESSDIYRTRPRTSDLYVRALSGSSSDDAGAASGSDTSSVVSGSAASHGIPSQSHSHHHDHGHAHGHGKHSALKKQRRAFEVSKLPMINDPRGTEKLIEALFNPVPVTQPEKVTPFTYLIEVDGEGEGDGDEAADGDGERGSHGADRTAGIHDDHGARHCIADGEADDDGSLYADSPDESGAASDYHSLRSHPSLQASLRSKHSTWSLASKTGLKHEGDGGGEETTINTDVPLPSGVTERRTWWQKVLSPPAAG